MLSLATGRSFALLLALAGALAVPLSACPEDPRRADLSGWVGEWRIVSEGAVVGTTTVRPILGGCAFEETREHTDGSVARGLVYFDAGQGAWREQWVSSRGDSGRLELAVDGDRLRVRGEIVDASGRILTLRSDITPRADGGFDEQLELFDATGASIERLASSYLPPGIEPTAPPSEPEPAPEPRAEAPAPVAPEPGEPDVADALATAPTPPAEPAPAPRSGVTVRSDRLASAPVVEHVPMASPMTLEFELGPLDQLPPDTGWKSEELAPYVADEVHVTEIVASRRQRRKAVTVELTLHLRTTAFQRRVDVEAILLSGDSEVGSARGEAIALGKLITSHDARTGRPYTLEFPLESAAFDALFADGRRPRVRLTVAVR